MEEFIVWYSDGQNSFSKEFTLDELIANDHFDYISDSPLLKDYKVIEIRQSVGLNDINNNKIYADCSIVEFESDCLDKNIRRYGFFTYNVERLQYMISTRYISQYENIEWIISHKNLTNIKIIDTIQENKLGLIKE